MGSKISYKFSVFMVVALLVCSIPVLAGAQSARTGFWITSGETGTAISIEIQNGHLAVGWGAYSDDTFLASWLFSDGPMSGPDNYSGTLYKFTGGQCFTCAPVLPASQESMGTISIVFMSDTTAYMTAFGVSKGIVKSEFTASISPAKSVWDGGGKSSADITQSARTGFWENGAESGDALSIEIQNAELAVGWGAYDEVTGQPTWLFSNGPMLGPNTYQGPLYRFAGGSCFTCAPTPFTSQILLGAITINFTTEGTATLSAMGVTKFIKKSVFLPNALVIGTDFTTTGNYSSITLSNLNVNASIGILDSSDNVARVSPDRDYLFIVRRFGTNAIQVFQPSGLGGTPIADFSTNDSGGSSSNPQDILMLSQTKAYVTRYELATMLIVNPLTGEHLGTIDLSAFADADGIPEMADMVWVNGKVYVACQRLDRNNLFTPAEAGILVIIDPATDTVTGSVTLDGQNPYVVKYVPELDRIVSASVGSFFAEDGGLETVNPNDDTAEGFILLNSTLGVVATTDFDFVTPTQLFGLTTTSSFGTTVYRLSLTGDPIIATLASSESFDFFDIALAQAQLLLADQNLDNPGVRVFSVVNNMEVTTTEPLNVNLLPASIAPY